MALESLCCFLGMCNGQPEQDLQRETTDFVQPAAGDIWNKAVRWYRVVKGMEQMHAGMGRSIFEAESMYLCKCYESGSLI